MILRLKRIILSIGFLSFCLFYHQAKAQNYVQYSGVVVATDSSKPISFATIYDITNGNGTFANYQGFFSLVVSPGDSVIFTSIGFIRHCEVIPKDVNADKLSAEIKLDAISYKLPQATIYPYPTRDQFRYEFIHLNIPDDDLARAQKNLSPEQIMALIQNAPPDPTINHIKTAQQYSQSLYYIGQYKPINLLNPIAWAQFFEALKNGELKNPNPSGSSPDDNSGQ